MHRFQEWRDALNVARDEKTVAAIMRDYAHAITPQVVDLLPAEAREALSGEMDVQGAAVTLLHVELTFRGNPEIGLLLHEIAHTFAAASVRLSRVRTEPIVPTPEVAR